MIYLLVVLSHQISLAMIPLSIVWFIFYLLQGSLVIVPRFVKTGLTKELLLNYHVIHLEYLVGKKRVLNSSVSQENTLDYLER